MNQLICKGQRLLLLALLLLASSEAMAQEVKFKTYQKLERDLVARTKERFDLNGTPCAVVRVTVPDAKSFVFEGNIIGAPMYQPGEVLVWMTQGSRNITVKSDKYGFIKYDFPEKLRKHMVYRLSLGIELNEDKKVRTLVMPVVGVGEAMSYGVMVGIVKKVGGYVKAKYNFQNLSTDFVCDANGVIEGTDAPSWFTGGKKNARFAITGGLLYRVARPFYCYAGAGYGYKKMGWEMESGEWAENKDKTYSGVEAEAGVIFRIKNFALSAGVQSNTFKYWEGNFGIGIMF